MSSTPSLDTTPAPRPVKRAWRGESPDERAQQRRERLMAAALEAFGRKGVTRTTMRDICREAGLTQRYFYETFQNTEHAFDEVYNRLKQASLVRVMAALADARQDIEHLARAGLHAFYTYIQEDPRRARIMLLDASSEGHRSYERSRNLIKDYVLMMDGLSAQLFPSIHKQINVEYLAFGLVGMTVQVGTAWAAGGMQTPVEEVLDHNLYAWRGLQAWIDQRLAVARASLDS
jgi:AcrR family transcriptional regulator